MAKNILSRIRITLPKFKNSETGAPSWKTHYLIPIPKHQREFWPPYWVNFALQTDVGTVITHVVGDSGEIGDPNAGSYITKGLRPWFRSHPELKEGSIIEGKKYDERLYSIEVLR